MYFAVAPALALEPRLCSCECLPVQLARHSCFLCLEHRYHCLFLLLRCHAAAECASDAT